MSCSPSIYLFLSFMVITVRTHISEAGAQVCCSLNLDRFTGGVHIDCSKRQLQTVPYNMNKSITNLDMSFNNITSLEEGSFETLPSLVVLNLTESEIQTIHPAAFTGLDKLEELYLSNNPVLQCDLPDNVFRGLASLNTLYMWRKRESTLPVVKFGAISNLENLEKLAITPNEQVDLPAELGTLINLKVLTLAFGVINIISQEILEPLSGLNLEELALYGMHINHIENGAFIDFPNLRLLNLACNEHKLTLSAIIDALSTSTNINVSSLIVDSVGTHSKGNVLGPQDIPNCRIAWTNLKKLSVRSIGPVMIIKPELLIKCFTSLELLAASSNNVFTLTSLPISQFRNLEIVRKLQLRSVDASHLQAAGDYTRVSSGHNCYNSAWIPGNEDFFPPLIAADENCMQKNHTLPSISGSECPSPQLASLPPCLTYLDLYWTLSIQMKADQCTLVAPNSLRFVDISGLSGHDPGSLQKRVFGLNDLEFINAANSGIRELAENYSATLPALKTVILRDNYLYQPHLPYLTELLKLETLDISGNKIESLDQNIFSKFISLILLNVSRNGLQDASFLINSTKSLLKIDLSGNKLPGLTDNVTKWLDTIENLSINLNHNPLICSCEYLSFMKWMKVTQVKITKKENLDCIYDNRRQKLSAIDVKSFQARCHSSNLKISLGAVAFSLLLLFTISSLTVYKLRWKIRWRYYRMRYRSKHQNEYLLDDTACMSRYNSYVIFSMDDDEVRPWVAHELCTKVESEWQEGPLFIPGLRDDRAGFADVDNITEGIMSSRKALWVVSPAFFMDKHCEIAANFAFYHLGATRNMIIIWERRLARYQIPRQFRNICNRKHGIPRVSYCYDDEDGSRLFWTKLNDFISEGNNPHN